MTAARHKTAQASQDMSQRNCGRKDIHIFPDREMVATYPPDTDDKCAYHAALKYKPAAPYLKK